MSTILAIAGGILIGILVAIGVAYFVVRDFPRFF